MHKETRRIIYQKVFFYYAVMCCLAGVVLFWVPKHYTRWPGAAVAFLFVGFWTALAARPMRTEAPAVCIHQRRITTILLVADVVHLIFWYLGLCIAGV